ncbi:MAG: DUF4202 domain-containing protein [Sandaracinaceae bacterium]
MPDRFAKAMLAFDALHAADPTLDEHGDPAELVYARRMTAALATLIPEPSEALALAVRAQHLQRWTLPRDSYPPTKVGYHAWRKEQAARHETAAAAVLRSAGYDEDEIARVGSLIRKRGLGRDDEAQALEDAACLVFLEHELARFAEERCDDDEVIAILQKTWAKMGEAGRARARELTLDGRAAELLTRALAGATEPA